MSILDRIQEKEEQGVLTPEVALGLKQLYGTFRESIVQGGLEPDALDEEVLNPLFERSCLQGTEPFTFDYHHKGIRAPVDYYRVGLEFVRNVIDWPKSGVQGWDSVAAMERQLDAGENVILFGNHQIEMDPQILSVLLEEQAPRIATEVIFVAGHRVTTDPVAVPFSMGRNLLCIHSKRHIDHPPEERAEKQRHNQRTMQVMRDLLAEGGHCIYVAPSGGRDRFNGDGRPVVSDFDPQAIEMFYLMAKRAGTPTHFYPLALCTSPILPPPKEVLKDLGEPRQVGYAAVHAIFGEEFDMDHYAGSELSDKRERRAARAAALQKIVTDAHDSV